MTATMAATGFSMTESEIKEFQGLTDVGEIARAAKHRKQCKKQGIRPTPPSKWVKCEICGYRTPGSLISHMREHGGLAKYSRQVGKLPEQVQLVSDDLMERFVQAGNSGREKAA